VLGGELFDKAGVDPLGAEGLHQHRNRTSDADRVCHLDLGPCGEPSRDDVLGHVPCGVGGGPVHFGRVLAGERAAAVSREPAVGVHDDLPPSQARVADRPADHEPAGGVDQQA
jgi:hypothetical protein